MATEAEAADLRGPRGGPARSNGTRDITAVAVTTSSVQKDVSGANFFNGTHYQGRFVRMICDQNLFYFWTDTAGQTVTETATEGTTPTQQCDMLPANTPREEVPGGAQIVIKGAAAGTLRLCIVQTVLPNS